MCSPCEDPFSPFCVDGDASEEEDEDPGLDSTLADELASELSDVLAAVPSDEESGDDCTRLALGSPGRTVLNLRNAAKAAASLGVEGPCSP